MSVGATIKKLRLEKGLTQEELGNMLGVKKAAVQKYESGQVQNLKQSIIKKLCEVFEKNPAVFIFNESEMLIDERLRHEVGLIEEIQRTYGEEVITLLEMFLELNEENKIKVQDYTCDLSAAQALRTLRGLK